MASLTNNKANIREIDVMFHYVVYPLAIFEVSPTSKTAGETLFIDCLIQNHGIIEYLDLDGTHKDHRLHLPIPQSTTLN